jgi:hypothetical protein
LAIKFRANALLLAVTEFDIFRNFLEKKAAFYRQELKLKVAVADVILMLFFRYFSSSEYFLCRLHSIA